MFGSLLSLHLDLLIAIPRAHINLVDSQLEEIIQHSGQESF